MITIGFCNLKGGVGKTTACQNIAVALAKKGYKVAVVDMDPQSNLSAGFGVTPKETEAQVFDLLSGSASWDDIVCRREGVDIIPSCLNLAMAELNEQSPVTRNTALREALGRIAPDRYDLVLLDSPPQLGVFTRNVLAAAQKIIVPMDGGFYSLFGLRLLNGAMPVFHQRLNSELEILGILMTNYHPRFSIAHNIYEEVSRTFGNLVFRNSIRQNVSLIEASSMGMSIFEYAPKSKGADCYRDVADELLQKLGMTHEPHVLGTPKPEPEPETQPEPKSQPEPEPEPLPPLIDTLLENEPEDPEIPDESQDDPVFVELEMPHEQETPQEPAQKTPQPTSTRNAYEEGIMQSVLDMLPESRKPMWNQILASVSSITRAEIDAPALREDFENADRERYKFYVLNDERDTFWPVSYPDQIIDPMRCVMKFDEYDGSAEVYI
ncbi:MAG: ParA family protein [Synergistaceae bacterium]|nr:ParA family protein [Synergistaceae bacterium]